MQLLASNRIPLPFLLASSCSPILGRHLIPLSSMKGEEDGDDEASSPSFAEERRQLLTALFLSLPLLVSSLFPTFSSTHLSFLSDPLLTHVSLVDDSGTEFGHRLSFGAGFWFLGFWAVVSNLATKLVEKGIRSARRRSKPEETEP